MHPSSLLSYYPTYAILDEIAALGNYKKLTIFIDLKNCLQTTYMEHAIVNIIESSKKSIHLDTSIFSSVISFLSFHKIWAMKRGMDVDFIIFFETGHSSYHKNISKKYKISRRIDDLYGLPREDRDRFYKILHANFRLIENACNKLPSVRVIRMPRLEADFIPYYLMSRKKLPYDGSVGYITYSNDHDLWQNAADHSYIFSKSKNVKKIIKPGNIMSLLVKKPVNIPDIYLPLAMSIIGDPGDDVDGIKNVGPARLIQFFDQFLAMTGDIWEIYKKVENNKDIFNTMPESFSNKYLKSAVHDEVKNKTISNNLKLVSFELISRALDNPRTTDMIDKRKLIEKVIGEKQIYPLEAMKTALIRNGVFLEESSIDFLYL